MNAIKSQKDYTKIMSRNILIINRIDPQPINVIRLLVVCMVASICHGQDKRDLPLQGSYKVREDLSDGDELFCAKLPFPAVKTIEIPINPFKPLTTEGKVNEDGKTFCVILKDTLYYQAKQIEYSLDLKFFNSSKHFLDKRKVSLVVLQVNRHAPRFEPFNDSLDLKEELPGGKGWLLNLNATDKDDRDILAYDIQNINTLDGKFKLNNKVDFYGNYAELLNTAKLDYELKTYYRIEVIVWDNAKDKILYGEKHTSTATIHINVIDVDDQPPVFQKDCGIAKVKEKWVGEAARVHAIDGDRGINHPIGYALGNESAEEFFEVNKQEEGNAIVNVTHPIDREDSRFIKNPLITFPIRVDEYYDTSLNHMVENRTALSICTVIIEDINDNPPVFSEGHYQASVKENTQIGIPVTFPEGELPSVNDIDEGKNAMFTLTLADNNGTFTVTPTEGINNVTFLLRVNNVTALDYERQDLDEPKHLQLKIIAKETIEEDPHNATATIIVELEDENDNYPQFTSPERANISENASKGDTVATIKAVDIDSKWFGTAGIRYSLMQSHIAKNFSLDPETGELTVGTSEHGFDREATEIHYLTIEARDNNGTGNRNTTQLQVELLDANDNAPIFLFSSYRTQLMENAANFTEELKLEAKDRDKEGTPNSEVRYDITSGDDWKQFQIDSETGILTPKKPLDFEDNDNTPEVDSNCISVCTKTYNLVVTAHDLGDPQQSSEVSVYITLIDENDNIPVFKEDNVTATINETSPQGTAVAHVNATDNDISPIYKNISYSIIHGGDGNFVIDRNSGSITVARNADLDVSDSETKKKRFLSIEASDAMMLSSSCKVVVNIIDINDKSPKFDVPNTTDYEILENVKDKILGKFPAHDFDETAELVYSIDYDQSIALKPDLLSPVDENYNYTDIFMINNMSELWIVNPADREEMKQITLLLKVVDVNAEVNIPQEDTLRIRITILDENDNDPEFIGVHTKDGYVGKVPENVKDVSLFSISAIDVDENNTITYSIEGGEKAHNHFDLNPDSGELRIIKETDYEEDHYINFTAVATDSGVPSRSSTIGVFIEIIDENDNSPQFEDQPYQASIDEHVPEGTFVIQVNASDRDSGDYGLVYFRIPQLDHDDDYFSIEPSTGIITVKGDLDRELQEVYKINVQAYDNPKDRTNQRTNTSKVLVTLLDINDHAPVIEAIDECVSIPETRPVNTTITKIKATDKDKENTSNSEIEFFVEENDYFEITLDGTLFINASLENQHQKFQVIVMAKDKGIPPLNSTESFCIEVYDENTHRPRFLNPPPDKKTVIVIDENTERRKEVYLFEAVDDDNNKETNGRVSYKLLGTELQDDKGDFIINEDTGSLRLNTLLDKGTTPEYKLEVQACDNGVPELCSDQVAILHIYIRSKSDTKPHFKQSTAEVSFTEHSTPGTEKQYIPEAELKEEYVENASVPICYYIIGGDDEFFNLDKSTRMLTIKTDVDREVTPFLSIVIQAEVDCLNDASAFHKESPNSPNVITIKVRIIDINDNAPVFLKKEFYGGVNAKDKAGKHILTISATDADEGENAVITYLITSEIEVNNGEGLDQVSTYFNLNETTGEITLAFQPSTDTKGHFTFTVLAKDIDDLNDTAKVSIYLMRSDQQIKLIIRKSFNEITEEDISHLQNVLINITNHIVNIDDVAWYSGSNKHYKGFTEVFIHCVDRETNQVLESDKAIRIIDDYYRNLLEDSSIGLIGSEKNIEEEKDQKLWERHGHHILYGVIGVLCFAILLALMVYFIRVNSYKRLLKAATTKAFGPDDTALNDFGKTAVPNTNLHAIQGSNPIWNQDDEIIKKLYDKDNISENESTNSLDVNVVEPTVDDNCKENPLFINEEEEIENRKDSTELLPESPAVFGESKYNNKQSIDLGSRLSVLRAVDNDWRRRLTNGSITPITSEKNFSFGTAKIGETDEV